MSKNVVLCVDDEPMVLRLCSLAVAEAGFRPVVAESGDAGLEAFQQLRDQICLVLSDFLMPGMSGLEMVSKILEIDASVPVLIMTGYSEEVVALQPDRRLPVIRKPFLAAELIKQIQSLVGTPHGGVPSVRPGGPAFRPLD